MPSSGSVAVPVHWRGVPVVTLLLGLMLAWVVKLGLAFSMRTAALPVGPLLWPSFGVTKQPQVSPETVRLARTVGLVLLVVLPFWVQE